MRIENLTYKVQNYRHMNKLLIILSLFASISAYTLYKYSAQRAELDAKKAQNQDGFLRIMLLKPSNLPMVKDLLTSIAGVYVRGLWLTKINYLERNNELRVTIRAIDQSDIYKYSMKLGESLRKHKLCLKTTDLTKRDADGNSKKAQGNKPLPFVLAYLAQKKTSDAAKKKGENDKKDKQPEEKLRWIYNFEAEFTYNNCF